MLEVVVGEEVELIEKVSDVDAAEGIHLRERKDEREACHDIHQLSIERSQVVDVLDLFSFLVWHIPAHVDHLIVLFQVVDRHRHVVVSRHDLGIC